jgi:tripartite-type tricarboxylate transporter receptor subunit TctC
VAINWVGALTSRPTPLMVVRSDGPATTVEGARLKEVTIGATGPDSSTSAYPRLLNEVAGTRMKAILGYEGGTEIMLAIQRGEVHGRGGYDWETLKREHADWLKSGFITPMVQMALKSNPELPNVPIVTSYAKSPDDLALLELVFGTQQFSRAFSAPPNVPPARLAALQAAFDAMVKDPAFLADAKRTLPEPLDISPGVEIQAYVKKIAATPQPVLDRAAHFIGHD